MAVLTIFFSIKVLTSNSNVAVGEDRYVGGGVDAFGGCVDVVGDHGGGRILVDDQVTGEGSQQVVGLERLCREGRRAGGKVSQTHLATLVVFCS